MSIDNPETSSGGNTIIPPEAQEQAKHDLDQVTGQAKHDLDAIKQRAAEDVRGLQHEAGAKMGEATEKVKSTRRTWRQARLAVLRPRSLKSPTNSMVTTTRPSGAMPATWHRACQA